MTEQANINKDNTTTEDKKLFSPKAGMEKSKAAEVIMPKSTSDPPIAGVTTYSGMKTESRPNAISWKKNPKRHIARGLR